MSKEIIIESVNCNDQLVDMLTIFGDLKFNVFLLSLEMLQLGGSVGNYKKSISALIHVLSSNLLSLSAKISSFLVQIFKS